MTRAETRAGPQRNDSIKNMMKEKTRIRVSTGLTLKPVSRNHRRSHAEASLTQLPTKLQSWEQKAKRRGEGVLVPSERN